MQRRDREKERLKNKKGDEKHREKSIDIKENIYKECTAICRKKERRARGIERGYRKRESGGRERIAREREKERVSEREKERESSYFLSFSWEVDTDIPQ